MNKKWKIVFMSAIVLSLLIISGCSGKTKNQLIFTGTVMTGAQLGDVKSHCAEGLYLVANEGEYLTGQTTMLLLRVPSGANETQMLSDQQYVGKKVEVVGVYPAREVSCEALTCDCEDFILVNQIRMVE